MNAAHDFGNSNNEPSGWSRRARPHIHLDPLPHEFTEALCAASGLPPSLWDLSVNNENRTQARLRWMIAAQVCEQCPIRELCAQTAEEDPMASGVWGGRVFNPKTKGLDKSCSLSRPRRLSHAATQPRTQHKRSIRCGVIWPLL